MEPPDPNVLRSIRGHRFPGPGLEKGDLKVILDQLIKTIEYQQHIYKLISKIEP